MKKMLLIVLLMSISKGVFSQSHYEIMSTGTSYSSQTIDLAFQTANFCGFYLMSDRNIIVFDDGSIVELKSKAEIISEGNNISDACVLDDEVKLEVVEWSISPSGSILRGSTAPLSAAQKVIIED